MAAKVPEQKIADCRELYLRYGGADHARIAAGMRAKGWQGFTKRNLYARTRGGRVTPGWPERFGWDREVFTAETQRRGEERREERERRRREEKDKVRPGGATETCSASFVLPQRLGVSAVETIPDSADSPGSPLSFHAWLKTMPSAWDWDLRHQLYLYEQLQKVTDGETKRLMIFMPPRHGKSELVTVRYAAFRLRQSPSTRVIISSYNQKLADNFSRKVRRVLIDDAEARRKEEEEFGSRGEGEMRQHSLARQLPFSPSSSSQRRVSAVNDPESPFPFTLQRPLNRVSEWETTAGGGLKAVGVGAGVTGFGADLIIVDDPVKGREEASSEACRERLWNWFNDDLSTRLEPGGAIILIQTRWHEDDLAGRLLREADGGGEQWTVVSLPALAEGSSERSADTPVRTDAAASEHASGTDGGNGRHAVENGVGDKSVPTPSDPLRRTPGEALWPERFPAVYFERLRERRGEFHFASLYQQRPVPAEGGVFKREWFRYIVDQPPKGLKWKRGYDLAISTARTADYTATFRVAIDASGYLYIDGGCRRRIGFPEQKRLISHYIRTERDTEHGIETALHGRAFMQELHSDARHHGRRFRGVDARGDKLRRAGTWLTAAAEGRIRLVRGHWNRAFVDEVCSFPHGKHDDQIDAVSVAMALYDKPPATLFFISPNNPNGEIRVAGQRPVARLP